ncbi:hypothetical protein ACHAQA_000282 [Verticillium albo-atrum]
MQLNVSLVVLTMLSAAEGLGINCRGSSSCPNVNFMGASGRLKDMINRYPDNFWFNDGQQVACATTDRTPFAICAFLQGTGTGANGAKVKQLAQYIVNHGCNICGSVPLFYDRGSGYNDVAKHGQLTFNYVTKPCTGYFDHDKTCYI